MEKFNKDISVVFPAYNEEENIEICILIAYYILKELVRNFEIIIVNDGSIDKTAQICSSLCRRFPEIKVISWQKNKGYGAALCAGFKSTKFDYLFFSDADRQFDIMNLKDLLKYIDEYDIVIGFRKNRQDSWKRKTLSFGYNMLVRIIFGLNVTDIDCAFKLFRRKVFEKIEIQSERFFVNTEILAKSKTCGFTIKEVGVAHFPRYEGESKIGFNDIPRTIRELTRIYRLLQLEKNHE